MHDDASMNRRLRNVTLDFKRKCFERDLIHQPFDASVVEDADHLVDATGIQLLLDD